MIRDMIGFDTWLTVLAWATRLPGAYPEGFGKGSLCHLGLISFLLEASWIESSLIDGSAAWLAEVGLFLPSFGALCWNAALLAPESEC